MPAIRRGEVWWVAFDTVIGGEIRKTRPAVVVSNNSANEVLNRVVVVPLSRQVRRIYPGEAAVKVDGEETNAMADQIATVAKQRLRSRMGTLRPGDMSAVEEAILLHLSIWR